MHLAVDSALELSAHPPCWELSAHMARQPQLSTDYLCVHFWVLNLEESPIPLQVVQMFPTCEAQVGIILLSWVLVECLHSVLSTW